MHKTSLGVAGLILLGMSSMPANANPLTTADITKCNHSYFTEMPTKVYRGKLSRIVKFGNHPEAKRYEAAIRNALKKGVNFAGHYTLAEWGCGTNCLGMAVIDAVTGEVIFYPPRGDITYHDLDPNDEAISVPFGVSFSQQSNLLIANPGCENDPGFFEERKNNPVFGDARPRYYVWEGGHFSRVPNERRINWKDYESDEWKKEHGEK